MAALSFKALIFLDNSIFNNLLLFAITACGMYCVLFLLLRFYRLGNIVILLPWICLQVVAFIIIIINILFIRILLNISSLNSVMQCSYSCLTPMVLDWNNFIQNSTDISSIWAKMQNLSSQVFVLFGKFQNKQIRMNYNED